MPPPDFYRLPGTPLLPQVEPEASFWLRCPVPRAVSLAEVRGRLDSVVPDWPLSNTTAARNDLRLVKLWATRNNSRQFFLQQETLSIFLSSRRYVQPTPPGAVVNRRRDPANPFLKNGAELARLFEAETPGLWHRQVLNVLLDPRTPLGMKLSPPRQALIWAALDLAISSALQAAWHYKWLATGRNRVASRERPWEEDNTIPVLYDYRVAFRASSSAIGQRGDVIRGARRTEAPQTPGTPRHPAYPSGHSTYSSAASYVLGCFFPQYRTSFNLLANNIGHARIWAGVHWFSDHIAGQLIGRAVGRLVIEQLNTSGIARVAVPVLNVPARSDLETRAVAFGRNCGRARSNFCLGVDPMVKLAAQAGEMDFRTVFMSLLPSGNGGGPEQPSEDAEGVSDQIDTVESYEGFMNPSSVGDPEQPEEFPEYDEGNVELDVYGIFPEDDIEPDSQESSDAGDGEPDSPINSPGDNGEPDPQQGSSKSSRTGAKRTRSGRRAPERSR